MRILTVANRFPPEGKAGVAQAIFPMAATIVKHGHQVLLVGRTPQNSLVDELLHGVRILRIPLQWSFEKAGDELIKASMAFAPDLMEVHLLTGFRWQDVLCCNETCQVPLIHHLHVNSLICKRISLFFQGKNCSQLCAPCQQESEKFATYTSQVDGVVSVSQSILDRHLQEGHFQNVPSKVIIPGITKQKLKTRRIHHGDPVIGFLGRIAHYKGLSWLMHTCKEMDLHLKIAGQGPEQLIANLQQRFQSSKIEWLGWVKPEDFLPKLDVLVVPSLFEEPLARVLLEAYSFGLPVIASRVGGMTSCIQEGVNGWGVNPQNPISLYRALHQFTISEPLDPLAVQKTMWEFTPDKIWQRMETFYNTWNTTV